MFFFFSNRLGCFGSLLLSAVVTVALLLLFGMPRF
jgi:integral membrane sensor domain MASE1